MKPCLNSRKMNSKIFISEELQKDFVRDCQIETDLSLLITDDFVTSITERLSLYKELDNIEEEVELQRFRLRLIDRFGHGATSNRRTYQCYPPSLDGQGNRF